MKNKLILLLKTLFASKGFNAKELESLADLVISQNTLTEDSTDQDLQTASEAAKPTADFVQSVASRQVSDVKKPKPADKPAPATEQPEIDPNETATDKALRLIMEKLEKQEQVIASFGQEKVTNTRREQYAKTLEGTSEAFKAAALEDFDLINFKDDTHFGEWLTKKSETAKGFIQDEANGGLGGDRPAGGAGPKPVDGKVKEASAAEVDAAVDAII